MNKPTLVVMAAGMGSRYGGLKQIDPLTKDGDIMLDFSLYDAYRAGFEDVVFVIKEENLEAFKNIVCKGAEKKLRVHYAFQRLEDLPPTIKLPEGREKPWGTGHAVLTAKNIACGNFAVINADDYYGREAFQLMYDFLTKEAHPEDKDFAMVSYLLKNTTTDNGSVSRGICKVVEGNLVDIVEKTRIEKREDSIAYTEDGDNWVSLEENTQVSMNFWGFTPLMMEALDKGFEKFLEDALENNPLKCEYFLPEVVDKLIKSNKAKVKVLNTKEKWYGITYREDKEKVSSALEKMKEEGIYPEKLWQ